MRNCFIVELTVGQGQHFNLLRYLGSQAVKVRHKDGYESQNILVDPQTDGKVVLSEI